MQPPRPLLSPYAPTQARGFSLIAQALAAGRMPHAVLVTGPPAAPTEAFIEALAARLLCGAAAPTQVDACGACSHCVAMAAHAHPRLLRITPNERGRIAVDAVRAATRKLSLRPSDGGLAICVMAAAQAMAPAAQNAWLKTLEEPPGHACILLGATHVTSLLPTLVSRVMRVPLAVPSYAQSITALQAEGIDLPYAAWMASWVGAHAPKARALIAQGFVEVVDTLHQAFVGGTAAADMTPYAVKLGQDADRYAMCLAVVEVMLRDALAALHHVPDSERISMGTPGPLAQRPAQVLARGADCLAGLRALRHLPINRPQALEKLLLALNLRGTAS